ncbi:MAG: hypothetical protein QM610_12580 [Chitinophagaceae bacterium]
MEKEKLETKWYHYLTAFFAGIFFTNMLPHYIHGISGKEFPTPFADPPGVGLSSPTMNVVWALINFFIGTSLLYFGKLGSRKKSLWIAGVVGAVVMSFYVAHYFGTRI